MSHHVVSLVLFISLEHCINFTSPSTICRFTSCFNPNKMPPCRFLVSSVGRTPSCASTFGGKDLFLFVARTQSAPAVWISIDREAHIVWMFLMKGGRERAAAWRTTESAWEKHALWTAWKTEMPFLFWTHLLLLLPPPPQSLGCWGSRGV